MSELAYRTNEHAGVNRRPPVWGAAESLRAMTTPVSAGRATTMQAPAALALALSEPVTPPPATESSATDASALLHSGIRSLPSTSHLHGNAHLRHAVKVPVRLSVAGLADVTGSVSVHTTISPVTADTGDVSVAFSYVEVGTEPVALTLHRTGCTFTAAFAYVVPEGSTQLDFDFSGHSYRGRNSDHRDFSVTTRVTFQEHGKQTPTVLATSAIICL